MSVARKRRFLVWGKTDLQLSGKYYETVCTGAMLEDGSPIRLFPIPFRYLRERDKFKKYQWLTAPIYKDSVDTRPESYRIDCDGIELGEKIEPGKDGWAERAAVLFQQPGWQFDSVDALAAAQEATRQSIGVVTPREIVAVSIKQAPEDENASFEEKKAAVGKKFEADREQMRMFDQLLPDGQRIEFRKNRIYVEWICNSGKSHTMQIMDWELAELQRRVGDQKALEKIRATLDLSVYDTRFFLGNLKSHPNRFTIVGLWYPKKVARVAAKKVEAAGLFD